MNAVRVTTAEGQASFLDDEEDKASKLNAVTCALSTSDIASLLEDAHSKLATKNTKAESASEQAEVRNRRLDEATATAVSTLRLQAAEF